MLIGRAFAERSARRCHSARVEIKRACLRTMRIFVLTSQGEDGDSAAGEIWGMHWGAQAAGVGSESGRAGSGDCLLALLSAGPAAAQKRIIYDL